MTTPRTPQDQRAERTDLSSPQGLTDAERTEQTDIDDTDDDVDELYENGSFDGPEALIEDAIAGWKTVYDFLEPEEKARIIDEYLAQKNSRKG